MTDNTSKVDAFWDTYKADSLKHQSRVQRGEVGRQTNRVVSNLPLPKGAEWQKFFKESTNNDQLFRFLSEELQ